MRIGWLSTVVAVAILACLMLPRGASAAPQGDSIHIVRPGETLSSIAAQYGLNTLTLARANGIANPSRIYGGQRLPIPGAQPTSHVHVIRSGDTLTRIALRYGVNAWTIARANSIANLNLVYVGQRLTIPGLPPLPAQSEPQPARDETMPDSLPGPWTREYFGNPDLNGAAHTARSDSSVAFNWAYGPPAGGMPTNHFGVRWTGSFYLDGGTYRFYAKGNDGVRLAVDGDRIIDGWRAGGSRRYEADKTIARGRHTVEVTYFEQRGVARVYVWWKKVAETQPSQPHATEAWYGEFFDNPALLGHPAATHRTPHIGFEWHGDSPMPAVPPDHFSARWTKKLALDSDH